MLFDFESTTTLTPTKHGTATARELHIPVKLITFNMVNMATSLFFTSQNASSIAKQQQQQKQNHARTTDTGQGSLLYSNLPSEIK